MYKLSEVNLIHKSDVYFDVVKPMVNKLMQGREPQKVKHHGEIYIYLDRIYLYDTKRWYKASMGDILDIKPMISQKQLLIRFRNYDMVLSCDKYSHLLALRDFLNLSQNYFKENNYMFKGNGSRIMG